MSLTPRRTRTFFGLAIVVPAVAIAAVTRWSAGGGTSPSTTSATVTGGSATSVVAGDGDAADTGRATDLDLDRRERSLSAQDTGETIAGAVAACSRLRWAWVRRLGAAVGRERRWGSRHESLAAIPGVATSWIRGPVVSSA